jgi:UDP-N-acetylglucosamine 2-epimerase (non-hydrolysing)
VAPFLTAFGLQVDHQLHTMQVGQSLSQLASRLFAALDDLFAQHRYTAVLVQGDTTTALVAAQAAFHRQIPVGHIEAGLRTDDPLSPFPEEMNRRLITRLAHWHFAATVNHARNLRREGVPRTQIIRSGNPVIDALVQVLTTHEPSPRLQQLLQATTGTRRVIFTSHRRENFAGLLHENLVVLRDFVSAHGDVSVIFPMHPNPAVRQQAEAVLGSCPAVHLVEPLGYADFIGLLSHAWLIASDSGGVQEEVPTLGKRLLILRESTERPEVLGTGLASLCPSSADFAAQIEHHARSEVQVAPVKNPFGDGRAAPRIVTKLCRSLSNTPAATRMAP